ncbi:hypothetical protein [Nonomuraea sp. NPDC005650]|uniref:hypothetical protein n=1 Tax=Nonomuraea sp. NPDC005650 TaxID=3157045 RepID=UPI0033B91300
MTREDPPLTPAELFDQAVNNPARRADLISAMFTSIGAAAQAASNEKRARQKARREARAARPEAIAARKAAARRGWETRRRNAEEKARADALDDAPIPAGPRCDEMAHNSRGSEVFCYLEPGHEDDDHTNGETTWPRDENEGQ